MRATPSTAISALLATLYATLVSSTDVACNNSPLLCDRSYGNITQLGAHDSPFLRDSADDYSESGNQFFNSTLQLASGVRLLTAQVYDYEGGWHLCHTSCLLIDAGLLSTWLSEIGTWLEDNPNDVVTVLLVNSDDATAEDLAAEYETAGVTNLTYSPPSLDAPPSEWPTLSEMIANGTRLVNFIADLDAANNTVAPYLMDEFTFIFETPYDNTSADELDNCTINRPTTYGTDTAEALQDGLLPFMNHFLYSVEDLLGLELEIPDVDAVNVTNSQSGTGNELTHATTCNSSWGRIPAFILVDFTSVGPAIDTVDKMNGVTNATGRTVLSTAIDPSSSSGAGGRRWSPPGYGAVWGVAALVLMLCI